MSVILLFFNDYEVVEPTPPLGVELGSTFTASGSIACSADINFIDVTVESENTSNIELFTNVVELISSNTPYCSIVLGEADTFAITVQSRSVIAINFEGIPSLDIICTSASAASIKFNTSADARFFDITLLSGLKASLEFVAARAAVEADVTGDDTLFEYTAFII